MSNKKLVYQFWEKHIRTWQVSGFSRAKYCTLNNIPKSTFHDWVRKINVSDKEVATPTEESSQVPRDQLFSEVKIKEQKIDLAENYSDVLYQIRFKGFEIHCQSLPSPHWILELQTLLLGES